MYKTYTGSLTWHQIDSAADTLIRFSLLDSSQALSLEKITLTSLTTNKNQGPTRSLSILKGKHLRDQKV